MESLMLQRENKTTTKGSSFFKPTIQKKLSVGSANDSYEVEADHMANKVMRMREPAQQSFSQSGSLVQRKCTACEQEEKIQKKSLAETIQRVNNSASEVSTAPSHVEDGINSSRGGGISLDHSTQSFMESRFGTDFSNVKIHTGSQAVQMSRDLNAQAFTVGNDIYFNEGKYSPNSDTGKHLLAHELTHTIQQAGNKGSLISRRLSVTSPTSLIPNPTGRGLVQTNRATVLNYLNTMCPSGGVSISSSGDVSIPTSFCTPTSLPFGLEIPSFSSLSATPVGCGCICDLVSSPNSWRILIDDSSWPHTTFDNNTLATTVGSAGSGGEVTAPSPNSPTLWGAVTASGGFNDIDPWLVLGHELCGHAWLGNKGDAGLDDTSPRGRGGHQATVERENLIRDEHSITRRGTHRQPYCGESFSHPVGTTASRRSATMSSFLQDCRIWRREYNRLNGTRYRIDQNIPVRAGEVLPP